MCSLLQISVTTPRIARLSGLLALVVLAGCGSRTDQAPKTASPILQKSPHKQQLPWPPDDRRKDVYVGSSKCAVCHQKIFDQYSSQHPMGRSVQHCGALTSAAQASLPVKFTAGNRRYGATYTEQTMHHTVEMLDESGAIYSQSAKIDFAIGSGTRGYSFVSVINGCLYQSPATWYSQGNRWDLSPGYSPEAHPGFGRRMSTDCVFCHTGMVNQAATLNRFESPVFSERSIGCERCHGPGSDHVAFHSSALTSGPVDVIVNPSKLAPARRDSVCFQCHLHGKDRILRASRKSFDFRPGDLISDVWVVLVDEVANAESSQLEAVTQSEQMVASACYKSSKGNLGCISCHSPHGTPDPAQKIEFYRGRCLSCHDKPNVECSVALETRLQESEADSCIQCHMPKASASDVPHTAQTDHRVLKSYRSTASSVQANGRGAFEASTFPVPQDAVERAKGLSLEKSMKTRQEARAAMDLLSPSLSSGNDLEALIAASWTLLRLGRLAESESMAIRALELDSENELALESLAISCQQKGEFKTSLSYVERILKLAPWSHALQVQKAQLLAETGQNLEAISAWKKALEIDPLQHTARESLIQLLKITNQTSEAKLQADILSRIQAVERK